jgi:hypothetical protein
MGAKSVEAQSDHDVLIAALLEVIQLVKGTLDRLAPEGIHNRWSKDETTWQYDLMTIMFALLTGLPIAKGMTLTKSS